MKNECTVWNSENTKNPSSAKTETKQKNLKIYD